MGLKLSAAKSSSNRPPVPAGTHLGICVRIIDVGTQEDEWKGQTKFNRKVRFGWELPEERFVFDEAKGEQPFMIDRTYNFSSFEKSNFIKDMVAWTGGKLDENFDIEDMLGKPCLVTVTHKEDGDKVYSNVTAVSAIPKSLKNSVHAPENPLFYYSVENGKDENYGKLPDFLKEMADKSHELDPPEPEEKSPFHQGEATTDPELTDMEPF